MSAKSKYGRVVVMNKLFKIAACAIGLLQASAYAQPVVSGADSILTPADPSMSKIMVYRGDKGYTAIFNPAFIDLNGEKVASIRRNQHVVFCVNSGKNVFGSHLEDAWIYNAKNHRSVVQNYEPGKTYIYKIQDEERDRNGAPTLVNQESMLMETPTSEQVKLLSNNINNSHVVPCVSYTAPKKVEAQPAPVVQPVQPAVREITLGASALFKFDKSAAGDVLEEGKLELTKLIQDLRSVNLQRINVIGYTDRLGDASYNQRLSLQRAETVRNYLIGGGVRPELVTAEGRGMLEPVQECSNTLKRDALVQCLQPNRRVLLQIYAK